MAGLYTLDPTVVIGLTVVVNLVGAALMVAAIAWQYGKSNLRAGITGITIGTVLVVGQRVAGSYVLDMHWSTVRSAVSAGAVAAVVGASIAAALIWTSPTVVEVVIPWTSGSEDDDDDSDTSGEPSPLARILPWRDSDESEDGRIPIDDLSSDEIQEAIGYLESVDREPTSDEIERAAYQLADTNTEVQLPSAFETGAERGRVDRSVLAPEDITEKQKWHTRNNDYYQILTATSLPRFLAPGWLLPFTLSNDDVRLSMHPIVNETVGLWRYENLTVQTAIVNHTVLNNGSPADSVAQPKQFTFGDPQNGRLTSRYTVHIRIERVYGEATPCPNGTWQETETVWRNVTVQSSANISVVPDSDASYIRLYAINRSWEIGGYARNQLAVSLYTHNSFDARPFGNLVISHPDEGYRRVQGPWRFYPVRNYKGVRESFQGGSELRPGSFEQPPPDTGVPHMYRDVAVPGTWDHSGVGMIWDITTHSTYESIPPGDTPEGVVRYPGNTTDYFELIGMTDLNGAQLREVEGDAEDIYGNDIPVQVEYREYQEVSVNFTEVSNSSYLEVCLTSRGEPVEHEPDHVFEIEGGTMMNDTTGDNGCFLVDKANEPVIHVSMEMSDWREGRNHYYEPVDEYYNNPDYWAQFATDTMQNIMELVATFMTHAFWWVLLLLFLWFKYTRPQ